MSKKLTIIVLLFGLLGLAACSSPAGTASHNVSKEADAFQVERRIVFFNGITDTYLLSIEGRCSINADMQDDQLEVICKVGDDQYKKHFLGLSDNVSYFVEQVDAIGVSEYHYQVFFRPETIIPDIQSP